MELFAGVTAIDTKVRAVTVSVALPLIPDNDALIVADPARTAVASPAALIVATPVLDELQLALLVISFMLPSEYVPEAAN